MCLLVAGGVLADVVGWRRHADVVGDYGEDCDLGFEIGDLVVEYRCCSRDASVFGWMR